MRVMKLSDSQIRFLQNVADGADLARGCQATSEVRGLHNTEHSLRRRGLLRVHGPGRPALTDAGVAVAARLNKRTPNPIAEVFNATHSVQKGGIQ